MESTIIFVLLFTFFLSSIFRTAFWLKIPIGCFLLVLAALSHDIYGNTGLFIYLAVFALPYILENKGGFSLGKVVSRRLNKPVVMNFLDLKKKVYNPDNNVEDISSTNDGYDLKMIIELDEVGVEDADYVLNFWGKFRIIRAIYWQAYKTRGLFISYITTISLFLLTLTNNNVTAPIVDFIFPSGSPKATAYLGIWLILTVVESLFYILPKEVNIKLNQFLEDFKQNSIKGALEIAKEEQKELIKKENLKKEKLNRVTLEIEREKTKQKELDNQRREKELESVRPEKENNLSAIVKKLDEL